MADDVTMWIYLVLLIILATVGAWLWFRHARPGTADLCLHWIENNSASTFPITKRITNIGRHRDNDVVLADKSVSRFHAKIILDKVDGVRIVNKKPTNHTRVGKEPVAESAKLQGGMTIQIGLVSMQLSFRSSDFNPFEKNSPFITKTRSKNTKDSVRYFHDSVGWKLAEAGNLSPYEMFVKTKTKRLELGTGIVIIYPVPASPHMRWIRLPGTIARRTKDGVWVSFDDLDHDAQEVLQKMSRAA